MSKDHDTFIEPARVGPMIGCRWVCICGRRGQPVGWPKVAEARAAEHVARAMAAVPKRRCEGRMEHRGRYRPGIGAQVTYTQCERTVKGDADYCWQHRDQDLR